MVFSIFGVSGGSLTTQSGKYPRRTYVRSVDSPFSRVADTWDDRTTRVPYSSGGRPDEPAVRNRNDPSFPPPDTASARRFINAAYIVFRITHAVGASTTSGSFDSIRATSSGVNVSPFAPVVLAVWVPTSE